MNQVLTFANDKVSQHANSTELHSQATQSNILKIILAPIRAYDSLFTAIALPSLIPLLQAQPYPTRRSGANEVLRIIFKNQLSICLAENLELLMKVLTVLINEGMYQPQSYPGGPIQRKGIETDESLEEQGWLARLVYLIRTDTDELYLQV